MKNWGQVRVRDVEIPRNKKYFLRLCGHKSFGTAALEYRATLITRGIVHVYQAHSQERVLQM
jgi:hypothetical protein